MNWNFHWRGEAPKDRRAARATQAVAWCVSASLTGALLLAVPDKAVLPAVSGEAVAVAEVASVAGVEPAVREASVVVVSDEVADRNSVEASIAAYGN